MGVLQTTPTPSKRWEFRISTFRGRHFAVRHGAQSHLTYLQLGDFHGDSATRHRVMCLMTAQLTAAVMELSLMNNYPSYLALINLRFKVCFRPRLGCTTPSRFVVLTASIIF